MAKVSILLSTYNGSRFLLEQLFSIKNQTCQDWQLIIRDDGSKDQTVETIRIFAKTCNRCRVIEDSKGNLGLTRSFKILLEHVDTQFAMFCDQDDVWAPNKVDILLKAIQVFAKGQKPDQLILVHSDSMVSDENLNPKRRFHGSAPKQYGLRNSLFRFHVQGASTIFNKALGDAILKQISTAYIHDRLAHLLVELYGTRLYIDQPLMLYRQHDNNVLGAGKIHSWSSIFRKLFQQRFFVEADRQLIQELTKTGGSNKLLQAYAKITSEKTSRIKKLLLLFQNRISIRPIDIARLCIKN